MILLDNVKQLFHKLFIVKTTHKLVEFFRYFFVSIASLCTDFIILFVLTTYAGLHYLIAAAISYIAGLIVNLYDMFQLGKNVYCTTPWSITTLGCMEFKMCF